MSDRTNRSLRPESASRRGFLRSLVAGAWAASGVLAGSAVSGTGCRASTDEPPGESVIALSDLPPGRRTTVRWRDQPIELLRSPDGVRARSLVCTHMSCIVRWDGDADRYLCPCHDGAFDAEGRPVTGPPLHPLREIPLTVVDGRVRLDEPPAGPPA